MRLAGRCEERRIEPTGYLIRSDLGRFSRRKRSASACFGRSREFAEATRMRFLRKSLKEQPLRTVAGAMVIGFILGALWKK